MTKSKINSIVAGAFLMVPVMVTGCADQSYRSPSSRSVVSTSSNQQSPGNTPDFNNTTGGNTNTGGNNDSGNGPSEPTYQRITAAFAMTGTGGAYPSWSTAAPNANIIIRTDNVLKVTVRAGQAGPLTLASGSQSSFTANYSCVSYLVTVGGRSVRTKPLLANGQPSQTCPDGVAEETIDFSDRTGPGQNYSVVLSQPRYDFYCQMYAQYRNQCLFTQGIYENYWYGDCYSWKSVYQASYCPTRAVYKNHTVTGDLEIQVNGTN